MAQVVIQPSYGNAEARTNWTRTLDRDVDYRSGDRAEALTGDQRAALEALHPSGRARFWGAPANRDREMSKLRTGDIILFTGKKLVRAVGEAGAGFRNAAFGDSLWPPNAERGSYVNVYSLLGFEPTSIPYEEIWELPGFKWNDNFMGLRVLDPERSAIVIEGLGIETVTERQKAIEQQRQLSNALGDRSSQVVPPEAVNTTSATYERAAGILTVNRAEALLVQAYRAGIDETNGTSVGRIRMAAGVTDLHVKSPDGVEIIEAKRDSSHAFVRQALGQLLDYVVHSPEPANRLTALFPNRPNEDDIRLLHRYGIDCVYAGSSSTFDRVEAPDAQRHHMMQIWQNDDTTPS